MLDVVNGEVVLFSIYFGHGRELRCRSLRSMYEVSRKGEAAQLSGQVEPIVAGQRTASTVKLEVHHIMKQPPHGPLGPTSN